MKKKTYKPSSIIFPFYLIGGVLTLGVVIACIVALLGVLANVEKLSIEKIPDIIQPLLFAMSGPIIYMLVLYMVDEKIIKPKHNKKRVKE